MKYESSMEKKYHADIVDTLKSAFRIDTEIPQHKNDPTPADLRDYLKNEYGKVMHGGTLSSSSRVNHYRFTASSGLTIGFNEFLTGKDNDLVLSYSQLTTFLRKNMDEVFAPDDDEEDAPSENSTYIDIILSQEEYKELTADDFLRQNDYCPYDFFDDYKTPTMSEPRTCTAEFYDCEDPDTYYRIRKCESCRNCWNTVCPEKVEYYEDDDISAEKILQAGKEYEALVKKIEQTEQAEQPEQEEPEDDTPLEKDIFEVFVHSFDENAVGCPHWKQGETLHANAFGGAVFHCAIHEQNFCDINALMSHTAKCCSDPERCLYYIKSTKPSEMGEAPDVPAELPDTAADNAVFDYSELDHDTAAKLEATAAKVIRLRQEYIIDVAKAVAYAHDLLANHNKGLFGAWCESIGITRQTANNLLTVVKLFDNATPEQVANLEQLNPTMLYAVAKPSAPPELVEQVMNGDITTHKDYIALKKQLEEEKERADSAEKRADSAHKNFLEMSNRTTELTEENCRLEERVNSLEIENKNLEARTLEVKEIPEEEIDRRAVELANGMLRSKDAEFTERLKEMQAENRQLKNELSKAQSGGSIEEQLTEIYEQFHDKAKYALKDCATFISEGSFTDECRKKLINRFRDFVKLLDLYFEDLNINSNVVEEYREMGEEEFL